MLREDILRFNPQQFDLLTLREAIAGSDEASKFLKETAGVDDVNGAFSKVFSQRRLRPLIESGRVSRNTAAEAVLDRWEKMGFGDLDDIPAALLVGHGPDDVQPWMANLQSRARMVCRITIPHTTVRGTGFLIAPSLVVTAFHVVKEVRKDPSLAPQVTLTFGRECRRDRSGHLPGVSYPLVAGDGWLLASSEDLDYAVLQVDGTPGDDRVDGELRGWVFLPDAGDVDLNFFVSMLHQPEDTRLCFSPGRILDRKKDENRFHYSAITSAGSSGAPVFDVFWRIVAVHTGVDAEYPENPRFTEGLPAATLRAALQNGRNRLLLPRSPIDRYVPAL